MNHPLLKEAFSALEAGVIDGLKRCKIGDRDTQHELTLTLQLIGNLQSHFHEIMETGKLARIQLERESMPKRILRRLA